MDVYNSFATDPKKEIEGVWRDAPGGGKLLIARASNRKYNRLLAKLFEINARALDGKNDAADDLSDKIMVEVMAETILLGFSDIQFKGKELTYSPETATMLLGVKDFRLLVGRMSNELDKYLMEVEVEVGKPSVTPSVGS